MKTPNTESETTSVVVFAVTRNGEILAVRKFPTAANETIVKLPGGDSQGGEIWENSARKKLLEETGYVPDALTPLGKAIWLNSASNPASLMPFLALECRKVEEPKQETRGILELVVVPIAHWIKMIHDGEVRDASTIAVTFLAVRHLGLNLYKM